VGVAADEGGRPMTLVDLTYLQFNVIAIIDANKHVGVTFSDVKSALASGDLFLWLKREFADHIDLSFYEGDRANIALEITHALDEAAGGVDGRERKKMGIEHNGICLLLALLTEVIQRRGWTN
jgi:hypothetical protein